MRSKPVKPDVMDVVLLALTPQNRLVCEVSLETGLRVSDVLNLKTDQLKKERFTLRERKTGKTRRIRLSNTLRDRCTEVAGRIFIFENRLNQRKPRTRQAVWKDLKRAAVALGLPKGLSPHSMRKSFAVHKYNAIGDIDKVKALLNHGSRSVTALYVLARELEKRGVNSRGT